MTRNDPAAPDARTGVTIGKFNPPHLGHLHLIETAASKVERLYVLLADRRDQTLPAARRAAWLRDAAPKNTTVLTTPDDLPAANEPWAQRALALLPDAPDIAFSSESWGPGWAALMGASHVCVDLDRSTVPISATRIRAELGRHFHYLVPAARRELVRRVVVIGAESSGKTTLANALARQLGTVWVPEHGRYYAEGRMHLPDSCWHSDEFLRIARAQQSLEADLARLAMHGLVVVDTDAMVTAVWHERYLQRAEARLDELASATPPDLYLACAPDFAWVQDGTRESEGHREAMFESMLRRAQQSGAPVHVLHGTHEQRLARARAAVAPLMTFPPLA